MSFVDTHVHLHFPDYKEDQAGVIDRARQAGVEYFVNVGTDVSSSRASLELAQSHPFIYASAGVHPHDVKDADEDVLSEIEEILKHPRVVAIGEVGLDFYRDLSPRDKQEEVFSRFIKLHQKIKKPLIVHCRDAYKEMAAMIKAQGPATGVMHCFSSDAAFMKEFVDLGFYISFAGPLTYKKNDILREACRLCPQDRLLLETDAPFLPPQSMRGKRNETAYMLETAAVAAELHGVSVEKIGEITTANAKRLFGLC